MSNFFDTVKKIVGPAIGVEVDDLHGAADVQVFTLAIRHAIKEFTQGTASASIEEEHRTSAFVGYLSGNLGWYNLMSVLSGGGQAKVLWNAHKKTTSKNAVGENLTGGDFGIAFEAVENGQTWYKLAFFQAKVEDVTTKGVSRLDISRVSGGYVSDCVVEKNGVKTKKRFPTQEGKDADKRLEHWISSGHTESRKIQCDHQVYKLASTANAANDKRWVHYVIWRNHHEQKNPASLEPGSLEPGPLTVPLEAVRCRLVQRTANKVAINYIQAGLPGALGLFDLVSCTGSKSKEINSTGCSSFGDLLIDGYKAGRADGWLYVSADNAEELIGPLVAAGAQWFIYGSGDGLVARLRNVPDCNVTSADNSLMNMSSQAFDFVQDLQKSGESVPEYKPDHGFDLH